ncbi:MAG: glycerol-3-phosphate 1-O-acyltransferase [Rhodobacteraceae bacterium]|nr:MAG: glycerol-3-phosphate 1-O-acyltransferase [Paracoccaceae bacterium]
MLEALPEFTSKLEVLLAAGFFGYLAGSIPFGILISKFLGLGDLRKVGSGNIGATNVLRTGNKFAAFLTLLLDFLKGVCTVLIIKHFFAQDAVQLSAFCALVGHCFPIWLRFRGGKGVATFLGVAIALSFILGVICCLVWLLVALIRRMSSLASLVSSLSAPIAAIFLGQPNASGLLSVLTVIVFFRHQQNISRIIKGVEPKIGTTE